MEMIVLFLAIGLVFGWCAMLLTIETGWPKWARMLTATLVALAATALFDVLAFESTNMLYAAIGALLGASLAFGAYELVAHSFERRPKAPKE